MARFSPTLFLLVLTLAASSNASTLRRDHVGLGRLVRRRAVLDILPLPETSSISPAVQPSQVTSSVAPAAPTNSAAGQTTPQPSSPSASTSPSSTSGGSSDSELSPTGSSAASASVPTSPLASSSSSGVLQTSAHVQASNSPEEAPTQSAVQTIMYLTSSHVPMPTQTSSTSSSSGISHAAVTALIVIAASVGAAAIVWTIIRKWKFKPSSDFEGRMQPIDWQPGGSNDEAGFSGRRRLSGASSFHSGSASGHADDHMQESGSTALNPIPDHDFTAGPAHLAPIGGYADLARGPSSQPMMQESLARAPSINMPVQYDQYGVPLHHGYNGY